MNRDIFCAQFAGKINGTFYFAKRRIPQRLIMGAQVQVPACGVGKKGRALVFRQAAHRGRSAPWSKLFYPDFQAVKAREAREMDNFRKFRPPEAGGTHGDFHVY
jgi:hypothetical protein